ncbi:MAG: IS30 family transposase [bacterium]
MIDEVHSAFERIQKRFPEIKTLTLDNDILFKMHRTLEKLLNVKIYFCHPYHSWEKGSIENLNRFIRKFIPKGSNLSRFSKKYITEIERKCNDRYLKCLDYATPDEMLEEYRKRKRNKKTAD